MKKVMLISIATCVLLLIVAFFISRVSSQATQMSINSNHQVSSPSPLTQAEERDLQKFTPQSLAWAATWVEPNNCWLKEDIPLNLSEVYKRHEGQKVEMRLSITRDHLKVYLVPLHTSLSFTRLYERGLSPPRLDYFCEATYEAHIANAQRLEQQIHRTGEAIRRQQEAIDPKLGERIEEENKKYPSMSEDKTERQEIKTYLVPPLVGQSIQAEATWNDEKRQLYGQVQSVAQREACYSLSNTIGNQVAGTIPDFDVGDPEIYILFEGQPSQFGNGISIEWIRFKRNPSSGDYTAEHVKNFGLPDETKQLVPLIRKKRVGKVEVKCPKQ